MKNLKMMTKLLFSFATVGIIVLVVAYFGLSGAQRLGSDIHNIGTVTMPQIQALMSIDKEMMTVDDNENSLLAPGLPESYRQQAYQAFDDSKKTADAEIKNFGAIEMTATERANWNQFLTQYNKWWQDHLKFTQYAKAYETSNSQADLDAMMQWGLNSGMKSFDAASTIVEKMIQTQRTESAGTVSRAVAEVARITVIAIVAMVGGTLLAILLGIFLSLSISRPLVRGVKFAEQIAAGDFTQRLNINQRDEIGLLAHALNAMSDKLRELIVTIRDSAGQVAASSEEIASSTQSMSQDTQVQASTVEETAAAMEQLYASVTQVTEHAQNQASAVEEGSASMAQVARSIDEITKSLTQISELAGHSVDNSVTGAKSVAEVVNAIKLIADGSEKIGGIVTIISEISDQTNLLALNASIEAARAGEHGRGFAVVADEVSRLADRSSSSAKEIESLIRDSVKNVENGVEMATSTQTPMEQIREASLKVKDMIMELSGAMQQQTSAVNGLTQTLAIIKEMSDSISVATEEQSTNARQVSQAVENVSDLTQRSSAATEEMASSTEELSAMAQELQSRTAHFKTDDGEADHTPRKLNAPGRAYRSPAMDTEFFTWTDALRVGSESVDQRRKELVVAVNGLHRSVREYQDASVQHAMVNRIASAAQRLFEIEERESIKSEAVNGHGFAPVKQSFNAHVEQLKSSIDSSKSDELNSSLTALREMLRRHFLTSRANREHATAMAHN